MTKNRGILVAIAAMAAIVVASNVLVQFLMGDWLTWGAFTYPFAFLVTDLANRTWGKAAARRVVLAGFATGIVCSFIAAGLDATTLRIAIGSGTAFLVAQMVDVQIFARLREGSWWRAPLVSSLAGSALDTAIFFSVAFSTWFVFIDPADEVAWANEALPLLGAGPVAPLWVSLGVADFGVKLVLALLALVPFRLIAARLRPA